MGLFLKEHDVHVSSFQDQLNQRFAPSVGVKDHRGGLTELVALQKEFEIFKPGRRFETSLAVLNLWGAINQEARRRFHLYLGNLRRLKSNIPGQNGDVAIVNALIKNLSAKKPLPVYFQPHDMFASPEDNQVVITDKARPLFYMKQDYLVISLPIGEESQAKAATKTKAKTTPRAK